MTTKLSLVIIFLFSIFTLSCIKVEEQYRIPDQVHMANHSFNFIAMVTTISNSKVLLGSGSGVLVYNERLSSYVLTAGHICNRITAGINIEVHDKFGISYPAEVFQNQYNDTSDSCLLKTKRRMPYWPVKIANRAPRWGDKVWNLNAGTGYFIPKDMKYPGTPGVIQIHEGYYSGYEPYFNKFVFTQMSIHGGASGSMILNHRGELVSIITAYRFSSGSRIHEISYGETLGNIKNLMSIFATAL
jgi:hypothetical protein